MFICLKGTNTGKAQIKWHLRNDWNPLPTDADNFIFVTTASSLSYAPGAVVNPSAICGGLQIKDQELVMIIEWSLLPTVVPPPPKGAKDEYKFLVLHPQINAGGVFFDTLTSFSPKPEVATMAEAT